MKHPDYNQKSAETLALQAVTFLASDDERIVRFVATSGLDPASLKQSINDSAMLAGVLDYVLGDEMLVLEFAAFAGIDPEAPARARRRLPGFEQL